MGVPGLLRLAALTAIALSMLLSGCSSPRPRIIDETRVEEWAVCSKARPEANLLCLQTRRPL
jgi:hypothetical protein